MTSRSDRIVLTAMRFEGHHGVGDAERATTQTIEVDVEMSLDLAPAGRSDDKADTVDYGHVFELVRDIVEGRSFRLLEAIADTVAQAVLARPKVESVTVRVRKLRVPIEGDLDHAGVEITRFTSR
jgi:dihydroneopterin aldolase